MISKSTAHLALVTLAIGAAACSKAPEPSVGESEPEPAAASAGRGSVRDVSVAEAHKLISGDAPARVIDVRTPGEFAQGHIASAINLDVTDPGFVRQLARLDPAATYVLHCKSGTRSAKALELMRARGFRDIAHMSEGFDAWRASGMAISR